MVTANCPNCADKFELYKALFFDDHYRYSLCGEFIKTGREKEK